MRRTHWLKAWPEFFEAVWDGRKPFEVREDDRGYSVGDQLVLQEFEPQRYGGVYSGREIAATVSYKMHGGRFGVAPHVCVLGLADIERREGKRP